MTHPSVLRRMSTTVPRTLADYGQTCSPLDESLRAFNRLTDEQSPRDVFHSLFPFLANEEWSELASRLVELKGEFGKRSTDDQKRMQTRSVISFIYMSNQIENCGTTTERETEWILTGDHEGPATLKGFDDVKSTYKLLRDTYRPNSMHLTEYNVENLKAVTHLEKVIRGRVAIIVSFHDKSTLVESVLKEMDDCGKSSADSVEQEGARKKIQNALDSMREYSSVIIEVRSDVSVTLHWAPSVQTLPQVASNANYVGDKDEEPAYLVDVSYDDDFV